MRSIFICILLFVTNQSFGDNNPVFIQDTHSGFDVHWSMTLIKNSSGKKETIQLSASDLKTNEKETKKLSDVAKKRSCKFTRSLTPTVLQADEWFQVIGNFSCEVNNIKMKLNPVLCEFKTSENKEMSNSSSFRIKIDEEDLYFIYGCNIIKKTK